LIANTGVGIFFTVRSKHADQPEPLIGLEARGEWKPLRQRGDQYPQVEVNELMKVNLHVRKSMVDAC
jgi:hypothetical protein